MSWRYKDESRWFPGVPARSLTDAEMDAAEETYPGIKESGVYEHSDDGAHPRIAAEIAAIAEASASGAGPVVEPEAAPEPEPVIATGPVIPPLTGQPGGAVTAGNLENLAAESSTSVTADTLPTTESDRPRRGKE